MKKTLDEIKKILEEPPVPHEVMKKIVLKEYDRYARILGFASYEDAKAHFSQFPHSSE